MIFWLLVVAAFLAVPVLAVRLRETRFQLAQARYERDVCARERDAYSWAANPHARRSSGRKQRPGLATSSVSPPPRG